MLIGYAHIKIEKTKINTLEYTECINELKIFTKWLVNNRNTIEEAIFRFKDKKSNQAY